MWMTPVRRPTLTDRSEINRKVNLAGESIIMKNIFSLVAKTIASLFALRELDIIVCNSAGQSIPYLMLFTMYGFV